MKFAVETMQIDENTEDVVCLRDTDTGSMYFLDYFDVLRLESQLEVARRLLEKRAKSTEVAP